MTDIFVWVKQRRDILIHTSVKLVTLYSSRPPPPQADFNPHEREARDFAIFACAVDFMILIHTSVKLVTPGELGAEIFGLF